MTIATASPAEPDRKIVFTQMLDGEKGAFKRWNALQSDPLPVCPRCDMPFDADDHADLMPDWCQSCEATLAIRYVNHLVRRFGRAGTLKRLATVGRRRRPSCAALKRAAAKRLEAGRLAKAFDLNVVLKCHGK